jgi:D-alanine-D-alanine ligase
MRLSKDHQPYILEVNPNPDISPEAGLARSARASGRTYTQFIGEVIGLALQRGTHDHPALAPRRPVEHRTDFAANASLSRNGSAVRVGAD